METRFHWFGRLLPVILAGKSIRLCKCSGNVLIGSFLAHNYCPVSEPQKRELLMASSMDALLFNQPLLEKVSSQLREDSLISSSALLSKMSKSSGHPKSS